MANKENLVPFNRLPVDLQREIQRAGGRARGEQIRQQKLMQTTINEMLNRVMGNGKTVQDNLLETLITNAMNTGNVSDLVKVLTFLRETSGQKPTAEVLNLIQNQPVKYVFITPEEQQAINEYIDSVIPNKQLNIGENND